MMQRNVLIVEDQTFMASLLSEALLSAGFAVHHAPDVRSALRAVEQFDPDAAVLDVDLGPGPTGFDLGTMLLRTRPDIAVLYLTDKPQSAMMPFHTSDVPANAGFLLKRQVADMQSFIDALEAVLADRPELARHDFDAAEEQGLSPQQLEVLRDVARGLTNSAIAGRHGVAESTAERWVVGLFRALQIPTHTGLNPRVEATRRYIAAFGMPPPP